MSLIKNKDLIEKYSIYCKIFLNVIKGNYVTTISSELKCGPNGMNLIITAATVNKLKCK